MKEAQVKDRIKKTLKQHNIYFFMPVPLHNRGVPDFICCINGKFVAIECKSSIGRLSKLQENHRDAIHNSDGIWWLVNPDNVDRCVEIIGTYACSTTRPIDP